MFPMHKSLLLTALVGCLAIAGSPDAKAVPIDLSRPGFSAVLPDPFRLNFDENGNASYVQNGSPTVHPVTGTLILDPTSGIGGAPLTVLAYHLPEPVVAGTVIIPEPGGGTSDAIRFTDSTGRLSGVTDPATTIMIYYSELPELGEIGDLADSGFPANLTAGTVTTGPTEVGPEGNNGFTWTPGAPYPANNEFIGVSDATRVPEPASLTLLLGGPCSSNRTGRPSANPQDHVKYFSTFWHRAACRAAPCRSRLKQSQLEKIGAPQS